MSDFDKAALLTLCDRLQHARDFYVRVNLDAKGWKNVALSEMPAQLAVWWAMHYVKSRLVPFEITPLPEMEVE